VTQERDPEDVSELSATQDAIIKLMKVSSTSPMMMCRACLCLVASTIAENDHDFERMKCSAVDAADKLVAATLEHWMSHNKKYTS